MKGTIDEKALKYIQKQGVSTIYIDVKGCSSWGMGEPRPLVSMGKPKAKES